MIKLRTVILLSIILIGSLSACVRNRENDYLTSTSQKDLAIPTRLTHNNISDDYTIPSGPMAGPHDHVSILPPGSVLTKQDSTK